MVAKSRSKSEHFVRSQNQLRSRYGREQRSLEQDVTTCFNERYANTKIKNTRRRNRCQRDLKKFLLTYMPEPFYLGFSKDHERLIQLAQDVILDTGQMVVCMPRGSGKTTILMRAICWSALYGHRKFPVLGAADDAQFKRLIDGIKVILETNELLRQDFPEVINPILALERVPARCRYQTYEGYPTFIEWSSNHVKFPTTPLSMERGNAGVVISGGGVTGAIRGMTVTQPDGTQLRPDVALLDDIQTRQSAKSPSQVQERIDTLNGDFLRMGGAGKTMSALCACTVIYENDAAEKLVDNELSPNWKPIRVPTLYSMPVNMDYWAEYDGIRRMELLNELETGAANKYYLENRKLLDEGAEHYWPERVDPRHESAIQTAMEEYFTDPRTFMAECQNAPQPLVESDLEQLDSRKVSLRKGPFPRGVVPPNSRVVTCYIDVQQECLFYLIAAYDDQFGGNIVDYGAWPEQPNRYFTLKTLVRTAKQFYNAEDDATAIRAAIVDLIGKIQALELWDPEKSRSYKVAKILVDSRWQTQTVERAVIDSESPIAMPSLGYGIGAKAQPMANWKERPDRIKGNHWQIHKPETFTRQALHVDTNYWKNEAHTALIVDPMHEHAVRLYADRNNSTHAMFGDHCVAEVANRVEAKGRIVDEWDKKHSTLDEHLWDCFVGTMVGASVCGVMKETHREARTRVVKRRKGRVTPLKV